MALILDDDGLLDAADGFAGWDDALEDDKSWKANWSRTSGPLTMTPSWRMRRKKQRPPAGNG